MSFIPPKVSKIIFDDLLSTSCLTTPHRFNRSLVNCKNTTDNTPKKIPIVRAPIGSINTSVTDILKIMPISLKTIIKEEKKAEK